VSTARVAEEVCGGAKNGGGSGRASVAASDVVTEGGGRFGRWPPGMVAVVCTSSLPAVETTNKASW